MIILLSVLLRIGYFLELNDGPCIFQHRWSETDMSYFDSWGRKIANGDLLSEHVGPPLHGWHRYMAQRYFEQNPDELHAIGTDGGKGAQSIEAARALWDRWVGGKRFCQDPLYPYLLGLTYKLSPDVRLVFVWQMLVGVLINVLVYLLARRFFGELPGVLAGLLACLYSPLLHSELILLRETLIVFAAMGVVYLTDTASRRNKFLWWMLSGLTMGLSVLLKSHFALFAIGTFGLIALQYRRKPKVLMRSLGAVIAGLLLGLSPLVARNVAVAVPLLSTGSSGGIIFSVLNAYEPSVKQEDFRLTTTARIIEQTGSGSSMIFQAVRSHPGPLSYLRLLWWKFSTGWGWYEKPDNANFYYYRLHSSVLRYMPLTFFILGPLSIVGLALGMRDLHRVRYLYLQVLVNLLILVFFFPVARYRLPMAAGLIPFAAMTLVQMLRWAMSAQRRKLLAAAACVVLVGAWTGRALPGNQPIIRAADYKAPYEFYYTPLIAEAMNGGQWQQAADAIAEYLRYEPEFLRSIGPSRPAWSNFEIGLAEFYGRMHDFYAKVLEKAGHRDLAVDERRIARRLAGATQAFRRENQQ